MIDACTAATKIREILGDLDPKIKAADRYNLVDIVVHAVLGFEDRDILNDTLRGLSEDAGVGDIDRMDYPDDYPPEDED